MKTARPREVTTEMQEIATSVQSLAHIAEHLVFEAEWQRNHPSEGEVQIGLMLADAHAWSWATAELAREAARLARLLNGTAS